MSKEPLRVIVADDNVDNAESMAAYLRLCGCEVVTVYDAFDIVSKAVGFRPHLVFLDIVMPRLDGYQGRRVDWSRSARGQEKGSGRWIRYVSSKTH